jgi:hypothetical protein
MNPLHSPRFLFHVRRATLTRHPAPGKPVTGDACSSSYAGLLASTPEPHQAADAVSTNHICQPVLAEDTDGCDNSYREKQVEAAERLETPPPTTSRAWL